MKVFCYVNNHGTGHARRMQSLAAEGIRRGHTVIVAMGESLVDVPASQRILLPPYDSGEAHQTHEVLHHLPQSPQTRSYIQAITNAIHRAQPDIIYVDVSAELTLLSRLLGYKLATRLMHGDRSDRLHQIAYAASDLLVAFYPKDLQQDWLAKNHYPKTAFLGIPQALEHHQSYTDTSHAISGKHAVALQSLGGNEDNRSIIEAYEQLALLNSDWKISVLGTVAETKISNLRFHGVVNNPEDYLHNASLIISSAGANAFSESLSWQKPFLLVPEKRPFDEQYQFAKMVEDSCGLKSVTITQLPHTNLNNIAKQGQKSVLKAQAMLSANWTTAFWDKLEETA